ncbi:MAG TPA: methyltransferase domain-containing protein [Candidatus Hydrogenedentes bacterium]|nr:methyltransferase domain-containing protein [Candidatus Hydrogenedentota bacterium]HQE82241.1 methyltransferase domain-containing protein [Candidatus Hydrogenedentota bacterium]HQH52955.1 methyltransferase domain-containing protein [Candidatus Hydrogenedentota bacterium]HQM50427.1 methyltransferase domain-containing protein [Candidatus Hydrogenedentota bacterium]
MHKTREDYRRFHHVRHQQLLALLARHAPERQERCLDIGGGGDVAEIVSEIKAKYVDEFHTVDLATDIDRLRKSGIEAQVCNVDVQALPYDDSFFDIVLFASVIEHLYNPSHIIAEIARVMRPGGILIVETPNAVALGRRLDALWGENPFRWFNQYNALENKALMEYCSLFYTAEEIEVMLARWFITEERLYGMHNPPVGRLKRWLRGMAFRFNSRIGDCFFVVARRKPNGPGLVDDLRRSKTREE